MDTFICGHIEMGIHQPKICQHLLVLRDMPPSADVYYRRWFTGTRFDADLLCEACSIERASDQEVASHFVCVQCISTILLDPSYETHVHGKPEVIERLGAAPSVQRFKRTPENAVLTDLAVATHTGEWFGLSESGDIIRLTPDWQDAGLIARINLPPETGEPFAGHELRPRLHVSSSGTYVAVANDYGRHGVVVRSIDGVETLALDGGDYRPNTVPFSIGFLVAGGRELVVHRTAWNRLDLSDPETGVLITKRNLPAHDDDSPRYLDYFHGRLTVSPQGTNVVDDGWIWHPVGAPRIWNLAKWAEPGGEWESETGVSVRELPMRAYYWDHAFCWLSETCVAVEGIGHDDELMTDGCVVFEIRDGSADCDPVQLAKIAGPKGRYFSVRGQLFSADETGLYAWDVNAATGEFSGARTAFLSGFIPQFCDSERGHLVELLANEVRLVIV